MPGGFRQFERDDRPIQARHRVRTAGNIAHRRGQDITSPAASVLRDAAPHARQHPADYLLREGTMLKPDPPGPMALAEERHEGDGEMGPDPAVGTVGDRLHLQVVLDDAEGPLDLP